MCGLCGSGPIPPLSHAPPPFLPLPLLVPGKNHCLRWRHYDMADHVALSVRIQQGGEGGREGGRDAHVYLYVLGKGLLYSLHLFFLPSLPPSLPSTQDHRPVCAALELNVDRNIRGFSILPPPSPPSSHPFSSPEREPEAAVIADDLVLFHIFLGRPRLEGTERGREGGRESGLLGRSTCRSLYLLF